MNNGLFREISEEEMMSVNGGCGGGGRTIGGVNFNVQGIGTVPAGSNGEFISNAAGYIGVTVGIPLSIVCPPVGTIVSTACTLVGYFGRAID